MYFNIFLPTLHKKGYFTITKNGRYRKNITNVVCLYDDKVSGYLTSAGTVEYTDCTSAEG